MRSKPFQAHVFKEACSDCHLSHSDKAGLPYQLKENYHSLKDGEGCMSCHGSTASQQTPALEDYTKTEFRNGVLVNSHSKHSVAVSSCVNCHFGRTATLGFKRYEMTSHNFKVVRPIATKDYARSTLIGMMNTCAAECHRNGRGNRNTHDSTPVAPSFGTFDSNRARDYWRDQADLDLADSLWRHYVRMYPPFGAVREGNATGSLTISSITPNPIVAGTIVRFNLPGAADISLDVYDMLGVRRKVIAAGRFAAGAWSENWDGTDELGVPLPAGTCFIRLTAGREVITRQVVILR